MGDPVLKARQIKAARALLDWSQEDLAETALISIATVRKLELGYVSPRHQTTSSLRRAFEDAGLEFLEPDGVRHRPEHIKVYQGRDGYVEFFDDVYETAKRKFCEIVVVIASETPFDQIRGLDDSSHMDRMYALKDRVSVKCIITEDHNTLTASHYCEYRCISKHYVNSVPFYVYDDKYAIIVFDTEPSPKITVIQSSVVAEAFRQQFRSMWDKATPLNAGNRGSLISKKERRK